MDAIAPRIDRVINVIHNDTNSMSYYITMPRKRRTRKTHVVWLLAQIALSERSRSTRITMYDLL